MSKYSVYKHPVNGFEAIKVGFTWPGFFLTWIWAYTKQLWVQGSILLVSVMLANSFVLWGLSEGGGNGLFKMISLVLLLTPSLVAGLLGNAWREKSMEPRGYGNKRTIESRTPDGATAKACKVASA